MKLVSHIVPIAELTQSQRVTMLGLMRQHYEDVREELFQHDLDEKDWVILLSDLSGVIRGFSTQKLLNDELAGKPIRVVFSGDTIVDREHWGDRALGHAWGNLALRLLEDDPAHALYWFLISQGYRTYRFLPLFFQEYFPRSDRETPADMKSLIDGLALRRYGREYDPERGIVQPAAQYRLRAEFGAASELRLHDPHVRFFVTANPRHAEGAELCCLAQITRENFTSAAWRVIHTPRRGTLWCG